MRVVCVCGARPNFMKVAPLVDALHHADIHPTLVHTGQHYDEHMSRCFFEELGIPRPDINLGVGSGSHAVQTAEVMRRFEPVCLETRPDWVVVVGDVNSTMACALVAAKLNIPVAHVEAGLRSFDRTMPEEINRIVADSISDLLFVSEPSGVENLRREGIPDERIRFVGNVMIDTLLRHREAAEQSAIRERLGLEPRGYVAVTLHRPSNVDDPTALGSILNALENISAELPIVFPLHPRTAANFKRFGLGARLAGLPRLIRTEPLGYLDFLSLMAGAAAMLTDSGGIQEETTILGVPCLTLRDNTERPITLTSGTNRLAGTRAETILAAWADMRANPLSARMMPELWDGRAAQRIVRELMACRQARTATSRGAPRMGPVAERSVPPTMTGVHGGSPDAMAAVVAAGGVES
ncbi:MAG: UDP-N-acetylglucosamine 2-epimerase (non-hydrolyzing) [Phycisphaerae bacterium]|nr:UDP-N-acetylglucosamine 2-epimerase (non-hydrolyzing) [Phycisphaerae bacterium]